MVPFAPSFRSFVTPARATLAVAVVAIAAMVSSLFVVFDLGPSELPSPVAAVPCAACTLAWDALWSALGPTPLRPH